MKLKFNKIIYYDRKLKTLDKKLKAIMKTDQIKDITPTYKINKSYAKKILDTEENLIEYVDI